MQPYTIYINNSQIYNNYDFYMPMHSGVSQYPCGHALPIDVHYSKDHDNYVS